MLTELLAAGGGRGGRGATGHRARGDPAPDLDLRPRPGGAGPGGERARAAARRTRRARPRPASPTGADSRHERADAQRAHRPRSSSTVRTVGAALRGFRAGAPDARSRRSALDDALWAGSRPSRSPRRTPCPGSRAPTVDGFAVRAADTYGASEGLPGYLDVAGEVAMGRPPEVDGAARHRGGDADRGAAAAGRRRGRHGRAHPGGDAGADRGGAARRARRRDGAAPTRTSPPGAELARAGRPLRAHDLGMLAAAGVTELSVARPPAVAIVSTGDEVVPPDTAALDPGPGARRDRLGAGRPSSREAGGEPRPAGHRPRRRATRWRAALRARARAVRRRGGVGGLLGGRARRDRRRGRPARASRGSCATGSRSGRASRPCWPSAAGCR